MKRSNGRALVLMAAVAVAGSMAAAPASSHPATGPQYPPPGDVTWTPDAGAIGSAGGVTWSYDALDMSLFLNLWWGPAGADAINLALDGAIDEPGETLAYDAASSDLPAGVARWSGSADVVLTTGTITLPTRFTLTSADSLHGEGAANLTGPSALVPVSGPYSINLLLEAFHGGQWKPAVDLYDALNTLNGAEDVRISVAGGFYYHLNQAPEANITSDPAQPVAEEQTTLHANATDADGTVELVEWDLDDDGEFDDGTGDALTTVFPAEGTYDIAVRVTDDRGLSSEASTQITVVRCDEGTVSGAVHDSVEPTVEFLIGEGRAAHEANCDLIAENGL